MSAETMGYVPEEAKNKGRNKILPVERVFEIQEYRDESINKPINERTKEETQKRLLKIIESQGFNRLLKDEKSGELNGVWKSNELEKNIEVNVQMDILKKLGRVAVSVYFKTIGKVVAQDTAYNQLFCDNLAKELINSENDKLDYKEIKRIAMRETSKEIAEKFISDSGQEIDEVVKEMNQKYQDYVGLIAENHEVPDYENSVVKTKMDNLLNLKKDLEKWKKNLEIYSHDEYAKATGLDLQFQKSGEKIAKEIQGCIDSINIKQELLSNQDKIEEKDTEHKTNLDIIEDASKPHLKIMDLITKNKVNLDNEAYKEYYKKFDFTENDQSLSKNIEYIKDDLLRNIGAIINAIKNLSTENKDQKEIKESINVLENIQGAIKEDKQGAIKEDKKGAIKEDKKEKEKRVVDQATKKEELKMLFRKLNIRDINLEKFYHDLIKGKDVKSSNIIFEIKDYPELKKILKMRFGYDMVKENDENILKFKKELIRN